MNAASMSNKYFHRGASIFLAVILLQSDCYHAFCCHRHQQCHPYTERGRIKLHQMGPGSSGDYLSNLSANEEDDESESESHQSKFPLSNIKSAFSSVSNQVERKTSDITSGFASAAQRGSSDIQKISDTAKSSVEWAAKKGTKDMKKTTLRAQKAVKNTTGGLANAGGHLSEMHFFQVDFSPYAPKIKAEEVTRWIDSQAKSGSEIVGSKTKTLILNFTGKNEYRFGDVTKEVIHRVASQEIDVRDWILLLKVSSLCTDHNHMC